MPIDLSLFAPFLLAVAFIELTPGPNMGWLALLAASRGRRAGFAAVAGVTLGLAIYMAASVFGIAEILLRRRALFEILRWASVLFLLFLAWEAWRGQGGAAANTPHDSLRAAFWRGWIANLLNPKAAVFYVALLPAYIAPELGAVWRQALVLGATHIAISIVVHSAIVLAAAHAAPWLAAARGERGRFVRGGMAAALVFIALWTFWQTR